MARPVLRTNRIELRPLTMTHLLDLIDLDADAEVMRYILGRARTEAESCDFWGPICGDAYADPVALGWWAGFASRSFAAALTTTDGDVGGVGGGDRKAADCATGGSVRQGAFLGWWSLSPARGDMYEESGGGAMPARAEAGWRLRRPYWRHGLATEGAAALFTHGFATVGLETIWAETMTVNAASRGVMQRLGMRHVATDIGTWSDPLPGAEKGEVTYEISRQEWAAQGG